jgi:hypothetical protein
MICSLLGLHPLRKEGMGSIVAAYRRVKDADVKVVWWFFFSVNGDELCSTVLDNGIE